MLLRHTLVLGDANTGKTAVIDKIHREANRDPGLARAVLVDAKRADNVRELIDLFVDAAAQARWIQSGTVPP